MRLSDLKLNPDNPRHIKPEKLEKLAQSIKDFPKMMVKRPIVYDENKVIIGGNMRYRAIQSLGMTEIPDEWTSDASDFTPEERHRFIMQDNAEMGEHDYDMVANQYELEDLDAWGIDVPYADVADEVEEDEAPEVSSEPPVSQLGMVYQLGRHRVMCGDSTDKDAVEVLMDGAKADMVFTDPPYNVGYKYSEYDDNKTDDEYIQFLKQAIPIPPTVKKSIVNNGNNKIADMILAFGRPRHIGCWTKTNAGSSGSISSFTVWEPIFFYGDIKRKSGNDLFDYPISNQKETGGHTCPKPLKMCVDMINDFADDDNVYDPFLGSGTTLIACEQTDRTCYGMELDPKYVDVIRKRYAKFTNNNELPENWEELTKAIKE